MESSCFLKAGHVSTCSLNCPFFCVHKKAPVSGISRYPGKGTWLDERERNHTGALSLSLFLRVGDVRKLGNESLPPVALIRGLIPTICGSAPS